MHGPMLRMHPVCDSPPGISENSKDARARARSFTPTERRTMNDEGIKYQIIPLERFFRRHKIAYAL